MNGDLLADGYYAALDPDGPDEPGGDAMTLWRVRYGDVMRYPKKAIYGPVLPRKNAPADPEERYAWFCAGSDYYQLWKSRVIAALRADPVAAQLRFAEHTGRCCVCARVLTGDSRKTGVGPGCRDKLPDGLLSAALQMRATGTDT
jgi:hypothetical protein